jgi:hypothetical protein
MKWLRTPDTRLTNSSLSNTARLATTTVIQPTAPTILRLCVIEQELLAEAASIAR